MESSLLKIQKVLFIYNPVSGTGKVKKNLYEIVDFYNNRNCLISLYPVSRLQEYGELLRREINQYDIVVCSGGDGTLNIVYSFLREQEIDRTIAYIPAGSTNDYAYSLGISESLDKALLKSLEGNIKQCDVGIMNGRYFLYVAAFGIFTKVSYHTSQKFKNVLGHTAYILEGIRKISELRSYQIAIIDGHNRYEGKFILGLVTNTLSVGGFRTIMPEDVELDDGKFEMIFIKMPKTIFELHGIISALTKDGLKENEFILYLKSSQIEIFSEEEIEWTLDGEYGGSHQKVEIFNQKKALKIYV